MYDDAYTRNESGELAVRTVNVQEGSNSSSYDDVFTRDTNGKLAFRVTGSGGSSDSHNKGYYTTQAALEEAYPTAEAGDWAIVGATDTVWVWDTDTSAWVDTDTKGEVTQDMIIVKSTTIPTASTTPAGAVYQYVGATNANYTHGYIYENVATTTYSSTVTFEPATLSSSTIACSGDDFAAFVAQWGSGDITTITHGTLTYDQSGGLLVFVGKDAEETTVCTFQLYTEDYQDAGFTITGTLQDGDVFAFTTSITATTSYAWTRVDVQPTPEALPDQTGQSGKFLTTNGTTASWSDKPLINRSTGYNGFVVGPTNYTTSYEGFSIGNNAQSQSTRGMAVGTGSIANGDGATTIGRISHAEANRTTAIGDGAGAWGANGIAIGNNSCSGSQINRAVYGAIQIGNGATNLESGTLCVALTTSNTYGQETNYKLLDSDGTVPADRLKNAINKYSTMPTAASTNEGWIVQYTGATDSTYTHGYIYECVSDGQTPATYSWSAIQVQAGGGGSSYTAGTGIDITGSTISVAEPTLKNNAVLESGVYTGLFINDSRLDLLVSSNLYIGSSTTSTHGFSGQTAIGINASCNSNYTVAVGNQAQSDYGAVAVGALAVATSRSIQIGGGTNNEAGTFAVTLEDSNWTKHNYKILDENGTIPTARFATDPVADGTYVPTVVVSSGVATRSWAAPSGGGVSSISVTLPAASWSGGSQTVTATGVTASNTVIIGAAPASQAEYTTCGVICTAQGADSLTFTATSTPTNDLSVTVLILA